MGPVGAILQHKKCDETELNSKRKPSLWIYKCVDTIVSLQQGRLHL